MKYWLCIKWVDKKRRMRPALKKLLFNSFIWDASVFILQASCGLSALPRLNSSDLIDLKSPRKISHFNCLFVFEIYAVAEIRGAHYFCSLLAVNAPKTVFNKRANSGNKELIWMRVQWLIRCHDCRALILLPKSSISCAEGGSILDQPCITGLTWWI